MGIVQGGWWRILKMIQKKDEPSHTKTRKHIQQIIEELVVNFGWGNIARPIFALTLNFLPT